jgi:hypothetical protein
MLYYKNAGGKQHLYEKNSHGAVKTIRREKTPHCGIKAYELIVRNLFFSVLNCGAE